MVVNDTARLGHLDTELIDGVLLRAVARIDEAYTRDLALTCKVRALGLFQGMVDRFGA